MWSNLIRKDSARGVHMEKEKYRLEMRNITKCFGGVKALTDVSFKVRPGEIHALIGENGAGKSTLMKILSGACKKDGGKIFLDGEYVEITNPKDAKKSGVAVIYQEFMLAPDLSVAENVYLDELGMSNPIINWRKMRKNTKEQLEKLGFADIRPNSKVRDLSVAYQQMTEICKNLVHNSKILVLDEPTAVLTFAEIRKLFQVLKKLRAEDVSIIYISHRLDEIFELADQITVLKDGKYVATVNAKSVTKEQLVTMMVGREISRMFPKKSAVIGEDVLAVEGLNAGKMVQNVSFHVRSGEILGFSGLVGSGRTETMRAVWGADKKESGKITYLGKTVNFRDCKEAIGNEFGMLPENRKEQGLLLNQSVRMNATLTVLSKKISKFGIINHRNEKKYVEELLNSISTKYGGTEETANSLSGGNQQKLALAKWLAADCRCIVLDEPTRGVDVGAKVEIYELITRIAEKGVAVIMISSEMPEIIGLCDRVMVMNQGKITGEFEKENITENNLIKAAMEVKSNE